jgi:hypothetical protein
MGVITADQLGLVGRTVVSLVGAVVLAYGWSPPCMHSVKR